MSALEQPARRQQPPGRIRVGFASRDGQALKIAIRIAERLQAQGLAADTLDLARTTAVAPALEGASLVVVVAAVRYGRHLEAAERFLKAYRQCAEPPHLALASVNLTARKSDKQTVDTNPYIKKLIAKYGLQPVAAAVFAGRLDYPKYHWFDRQMIRLIMRLNGGPSDGTSRVDYTCWASVDGFARDIRAAALSAAA